MSKSTGHKGPFCENIPRTQTLLLPTKQELSSNSSSQRRPWHQDSYPYPYPESESESESESRPEGGRPEASAEPRPRLQPGPESDIGADSEGTLREHEQDHRRGECQR